MKKLIALFVFVFLLLAGCQTEELEGIQQKSATLSIQLPQESVIIDFESFEAGDIVSSVSPDGCEGSIAVFGTNPDFPGQNTAMVFDSTNPTGGDIDLGTPNQQYGGPGVSDSPDGNEASNDTALGKVLILSEDLDSTDPDDSFVANSKYEFDFSGYGQGYVTMHGFNMLDLDGVGAGGMSTVVKLFDNSMTLLFEKTINPGNDNNLQFVDLEDTENVVKMVLELNNSGAIDNITFSCTPPPVDCEECDGKVTELTLQYNGDAAAQVKVVQKKDEVEVFNAEVQPGEQFSFVGTDKHGTLGTEIIIYVDGEEHTKIHTSCSQPIGPGLISGDFEVIAGSSRNGGNLCPVEIEPEDPKDDEDCCDGKVTELTMQYNGDTAAQVKVVQKKDEVEVFNAEVQPGEQFSFVGTDKNGTLGTEIIIYVDGEEHTKIHTSCSQPIGPGLISGDFEVIAGSSRNGGELCPIEDLPDDEDDDEEEDCCDGKVTELTMQYNGAAAAQVKVVQKKDEVEVFNAEVQPGEQFSFVGTDKKGTLGTEIIIYVDGQEHTKIHTSCSQPIGPGLVSGDFEVIEGSSRNSGALCPI